MVVGCIAWVWSHRFQGLSAFLFLRRWLPDWVVDLQCVYRTCEWLAAAEQIVTERTPKRDALDGTWLSLTLIPPRR